MKQSGRGDSGTRDHIRATDWATHAIWRPGTKYQQGTSQTRAERKAQLTQKQALKLKHYDMFPSPGGRRDEGIRTEYQSTVIGADEPPK